LLETVTGIGAFRTIYGIFSFERKVAGAVAGIIPIEKVSWQACDAFCGSGASACSTGRIAF